MSIFDNHNEFIHIPEPAMDEGEHVLLIGHWLFSYCGAYSYSQLYTQSPMLRAH